MPTLRRWSRRRLPRWHSRLPLNVLRPSDSAYQGRRPDATEATGYPRPVSRYLSTSNPTASASSRTAPPYYGWTAIADLTRGVPGVDPPRGLAASHSRGSKRERRIYSQSRRLREVPAPACVSYRTHPGCTHINSSRAAVVPVESPARGAVREPPIASRRWCVSTRKRVLDGQRNGSTTSTRRTAHLHFMSSAARLRREEVTHPSFR